MANKRDSLSHSQVR